MAGAGCVGAGPCIHLYHDPALRIVHAAASGTPLAELFIESITINGRDLPDLSSLVSLPAVNLSLDGARLRCRLPCGLGTEEGTWQVTVSAPGLQAKQFVIPVSYDDFDGGCPSSNSGSTEVTLTLDSTGGG
jgi:hypothetical protein